MDLWALSDLSTPWSLHVVATLRVADQLVDGPRPIASLAEAVGADAAALGRVLRHLIATGVFTEPEPDVFALNDGARGLLDEGTRLGLDLEGFGGRMAGAWETLLPAVKTGRPAYEEKFGKPFWEDLESNSELGEKFDALMGVPGHGVPDHRMLLREGDWLTVRTFVDVGGGTGALLTEILKARPWVRGILVDKPSTVARAVLPPRSLGLGQSFFEPLPVGAELYILKNVLADWPDAEAVQILRRCADAARPSQGRIVVTLSEEPSAGLLMMVLLGGVERTVAEFTPLAQEAGLEVMASGRLAGGKFVAECRPV
jgi:DNA-binding Lrp family transcriptional regulator